MPAKKPAPRTRRRAGVTLARFRALALAVPGAIERPSYGTPGFRAKNKLFARVLPDEGHAVVRMTREQRAAMLEALPEVFSLTAHYEAYDWVIVALAAVDEGLLVDLLTEAASVAAS
jgi:hypothetical protein